MDLTKTQRRNCLIALLFSVFIIGVALGGVAPLLALSLESRGISTLLIGFNASMSAIGVILTTTISAWFIKRFGAVSSLLCGSGLILIAILLFPLFDQLSVWFILRFMMGVGLAFPWVVSETWLNMITPAALRGRTMATYTLVLALGFVVGPFVIAWVGTEGPLPYLIFAVFVGLSALPILSVRHLAPTMDVPSHTKLGKLAIAAPTIFAAAMLSGITDAATFSFMPLYGLRVGFDEGYAVSLLSIFLAGNLLLQYPIGWLADHFSRRSMLLLCGAACALGPAMVPIVYDSPYIFATVLFLWGGGSWAIYGVALTMLGDRFPKGQLTAANAAYIMAFETANLIGPPLSGYAIKLWEPHGLMYFLAMLGAAFFIVTASRGLFRRLSKQ
jgi:MFS family permease